MTDRIINTSKDVSDYINCYIGEYLDSGLYGNVYLTHSQGKDNTRFVIKSQINKFSSDFEYNVLYDLSINLINRKIDLINIPIPIPLIKGKCMINRNIKYYIVQEYISGKTIININNFSPLFIFRELWISLLILNNAGLMSHSDLHIDNILVSNDNHLYVTIIITLELKVLLFQLC